LKAGKLLAFQEKICSKVFIDVNRGGQTRNEGSFWFVLKTVRTVRC